ncbi:MAG TPA: DNA-processing protein DprA [Candidatus Kapabacteria bacterium]|jgi:DNA processing protein|nr:DNA-processing protein DprA [Candidatus Kapabacteria bacterium]
METGELAYYLALHFSSGIGSRRLLALYQYFGSAERAFRASPRDLLNVPGIGKGTTDALVLDRESAFEAAREQVAHLNDNLTIITFYDEGYPASLKTTYSPPPLLYVRGNAEILREEKMVAIVGSRKTTDYGRRAAKEFAEGFAKENVTIVSGFAKGIDTAAHHAVFEAGGKTIAVLGSGVDVIYPATNKQLADALIESGRGIIVSELPLGTNPEARNFPWRNRIVSGLSKATIVVESEVEGGSMITASLALDESRDVFAVPGDIYRPSSSGPNHLIRESRAKLAVNADQVMSELGWIDREGINKRPLPISRTGLSLFENKIVDVLEDAGGPLQVDLLAERAGLDVQDILVQLLTLEFKSVVRQMAGKQFMLV